MNQIIDVEMSWCGFELHQWNARLHQLAACAGNCPDSTVARRPDRQLHFHGFEHDEQIALSDHLPFADVDRRDRCRHRRRERHLIVVRALFAAVGAAADVDKVDSPVEKHPSPFRRACCIGEPLPRAVGHAVSAVAEGSNFETLSHASLEASPRDRR
jgi:hypothetical protein